MEDDRCPVCGAAARDRSAGGRAVCGRCHADLPRRWPVWVVPVAVAVALAGLVLFAYFGA